MAYVILVTVLLLAQYTFFAMRAGMARGKAEIVAPATSGDEHYERCNRVHLNTLEQIIVTLPTMWVCATFFRADVAALLGMVFLIGRFLFSAAYIKAPESRALGMATGFLANMALLLCCLYAGVAMLLR